VHPELERLTARVREMIQDATQKGERLATAGERVSRAAERLARGLEAESSDVHELVLRLSTAELVAPDRPWAEGSDDPAGASSPARTQAERLGSLRLLGRDDHDDDDTALGEERQ
jgi:methyl-accepting chemotaxis protein